MSHLTKLVLNSACERINIDQNGSVYHHPCCPSLVANIYTLNRLKYRSLINLIRLNRHLKITMVGQKCRTWWTQTWPSSSFWQCGLENQSSLSSTFDFLAKGTWTSWKMPHWTFDLIKSSPLFLQTLRSWFPVCSQPRWDTCDIVCGWHQDHNSYVSVELLTPAAVLNVRRPPFNVVDLHVAYSPFSVTVFWPFFFPWMCLDAVLRGAASSASTFWCLTLPVSMMVFCKWN